jgi:hypothetical protein
MTTFLRFTEENDWEGETWDFYLQIDGNETELDRLHALVYSQFEENGWSSFEFGDEILSEEEVDTLVKWGDSGYLPYHNKVTGKFRCPSGDPEQLFYKGEIEGYFS